VRQRCTHALAAAIMLVACASSLRAQRVKSSLDIAGASLWYADSIWAMGSTVSPAVSFDWPRATIAATGTVSSLANGGTSVQAAVGPSLFSPSAGPLSLEISGSFGGSSHRDGTRTGELLGTTRAHVMGTTRGAWLGAGAGRTSDGSTWRNVRLGEAGAWLQRDGTIGLVTATPIVVDDSIHYSDFQGSILHRTKSVEVGLTAGARSGPVTSALGGTARAWGSASVTAWVHSNIAFVASAGSYPVDFTQGYPGGRFASIALRVATHRARSDASVSSSHASSVLTRNLEQTKASGVTEMNVQTSGGSQRTIRVRAASAQRVELSGDFTMWRPVALTRETNGWWSTTLPVAPGTYQMNVRVDGGPWIAPPGATTVVDEFGSVVGVVSFP
jgi:hypothetical protein